MLNEQDLDLIEESNSYDRNDMPAGYVPCDGSDTNDYQETFPNCQDRVIIGYSDQIPVGATGGDDNLPEFEIEHDHDIIIKHDEGQCDFGMFDVYTFIFIHFAPRQFY